MSLKPRTIGLMGAGAAVVAALAYVTFRTDPVPVDVHVIASGPMQVTINADGITRISDIYEVSSPITGTALRSPVHQGDRVSAGDTVVAVVKPLAPALLDSRSRTQAQAAVQEAEAALHVAETDLAKAQNDYALAETQMTRTQTLVERDVASLTRLEDSAQRLALAEASVEAAQARIDMASGTLERARATLNAPADAAGDMDCCMQLLAPANGVVLEVVNESERPVTTGAPLVSIGDPAALEIVADLLSSDAVRLNDNAEAIVERWGGEAPLAARLVSIAPSAHTKVSALGIEEQRVDAVFEITTPHAARSSLGHGFSVFLRIIEWSEDDVTAVPLSALFKRGDDWAVFVNTAGVAEERQIEIGIRNGLFAQVIGGLQVGDAVITHPNDTIETGTQVVLRTALQ